MRVDFQRVLPGLAASTGIALCSMLAYSIHKYFDPLIMSLLLGMVLSNLLPGNGKLAPGTGFTIKAILPLGIGLFGAGLSLRNDYSLWPAVLIVLVSIFLLTFFVSKVLGLNRDFAILLGAGMSICGASAIAIVSAILGSSEEDVSVSVISVITVGLAGMLALTLLPDMLSIPMPKTAFLSGATLPTVSLVRITAMSAGGPECSSLALGFKTIRVGMIGFFALALLFLKKGGRPAFPWYMALFCALAAFFNVFDLSPFRETVVFASNFLLSVALASIGLSVDLDSISEKGAKPLLAAFIAWTSVLLLAYVAIF